MSNNHRRAVFSLEVHLFSLEWKRTILRQPFSLEAKLKFFLTKSFDKDLRSLVSSALLILDFISSHSAFQKDQNDFKQTFSRSAVSNRHFSASFLLRLISPFLKYTSSYLLN